jgi:hypothetical protein
VYCLVLLYKFKYNFDAQIWNILRPSDFCMWGWLKTGVNKTNMDTRDEQLARFSNAADRIKKHEDQITTNMRYSHTSCKVHSDGR